MHFISTLHTFSVDEKSFLQFWASWELKRNIMQSGYKVHEEKLKRKILSYEDIWVLLEPQTSTFFVQSFLGLAQTSTEKTNKTKIFQSLIYEKFLLLS